ncbi:MAG: YceI family protein [Anaerolineaceae bacterium]|nr:YceI family protein [Anaerolineaceae bacterium]
MLIKKRNRTWLSFIAITLLTAGCATAQASQPTSTNAPAATTAPAISAAPTTGAAPTATSASQTTSSTTAANSPSPTSPASSTTAANSTGGLIHYSMDVSKSSASFKVREQLAKFSFPTDAIGKTSDISGSMALNPDGTINTSVSKIVVNVGTLVSDSSMRDGYVRRAILQTDQYPTATFVPTKIIGVNPLTASGQVSFQVTGNLTIKDVTKPVTWNVTGSVQNGQATGVATTTFKFEDFNLPQPQVPVVLSVVDSITLEVDLTCQRQAG